jgi:hypothetical protein
LDDTNPARQPYTRQLLEDDVLAAAAVDDAVPSLYQSLDLPHCVLDFRRRQELEVVREGHEIEGLASLYDYSYW